jgi:Fe-S cluster assembly protein SufB
MKYPGVVLKGRKSRGEVISIALAGDGQRQDTGAKMIHAADETTSNICFQEYQRRERARMSRNI